LLLPTVDWGTVVVTECLSTVWSVTVDFSTVGLFTVGLVKVDLEAVCRSTVELFTVGWIT
jgi:hypothetical protein